MVPSSGEPLPRADEQVALVELLLLERRLERLERGGGARDDHGAARLGVEPVDDAGLARRVADERVAGPPGTSSG